MNNHDQLEHKDVSELKAEVEHVLAQVLKGHRDMKWYEAVMVYSAVLVTLIVLKALI